MNLKDVVIENLHSFNDLENCNYLVTCEPFRALCDIVKYSYYHGLICREDGAFLIRRLSEAYEDECLSPYGKVTTDYVDGSIDIKGY